ncbi:type I restriction enzyme HsdR N-terminal domain-containing protein [uncultured Polaribacter sp.]|uniref:type I restriction enzyme HsdR N-terminal domain-containing protein n=1 Tax=uncultured Polaribacter sp. TaxID=174711 RepID=UPI002639FA81|nr:type I restriction enzyme HsdR N-terminal domain-containing protein [uncultured Polaribacter sp.]
MQTLNLPSYKFKLKSSENKTLIFDNLRKKYMVLTPEEWVRQHFVQYLIEEKKYPVTLIALEKQMVIHNQKKRTDILIFDKVGNHDIIVECKAPAIKITQEAFDQIARYNLKLKAKYLIVTNGLVHFYCKMDFVNKTYIFLKEIPDYK